MLPNLFWWHSHMVQLHSRAKAPQGQETVLVPASQWPGPHTDPHGREEGHAHEAEAVYCASE